jgi:hypothetical protein
MLKRTLCRSSLGAAAIAAVSLLLACGGDDTTSPGNDAAAAPDATEAGADVAVTLDTGLGDDSLSAADANDAPTTADSSDDSDAPYDAATDGGTVVDGVADVLTDTYNSPDGVTVGDDAANDATAADGSATDDAADATTDTGTSPADATLGDDAGDDATTAADVAVDAVATADAASDAASSADGPGDASDVAGPPLYSYTFDSTNESWWVQSVSPSTTDAGASTALDLGSTCVWSGGVGDPPGAISVYAAFDGGGEKVTVGHTFSPPIDLTGRTITMDIYLESGSQLFTYFYLFLQDENWDWMDPGPTSFPAVAGGQWTTVTLDVTNPGGFVSPVFYRSEIVLLGVEFDSGSGAGPGTITPVTAYIDNVIVQ